MRKFEGTRNLNKKFVVTALGVATLGFQLMQTNSVKADDVQTNAGSEQSSVQPAATASVADSKPVTTAPAATPTAPVASGTSDNSNNTENVKSASDSKSTENNANKDADVPSDPAFTGQEKNQEPTVDSEQILHDSTEENANTIKSTVNGALSVTATNADGSATSHDTNTNTDGSIVVNNNADLTANLKLTNTQDSPMSDYWSQIDLPVYTNKNSKLVVAKDADLQKIVDTLPAGARVRFYTTDEDVPSSHYSTGGWYNKDTNDVKDKNAISVIFIDPDGNKIAANQSVTLEIPLERLNDGDSDSSDLENEKITFENFSGRGKYTITINSKDYTPEVQKPDFGETTLSSAEAYQVAVPNVPTVSTVQEHTSSRESSTSSLRSTDNVKKNDQLISTLANRPDAKLYKLDASLINNHILRPATDWFSDEVMTFAGEDYYRIATNEWVKASDVYVYKNSNVVIQSNQTTHLVDSEGNLVNDRALLANTTWRTDRIAYINGNTYYRITANEFVPTDVVTVLQKFILFKKVPQPYY